MKTSEPSVERKFPAMTKGQRIQLADAIRSLADWVLKTELPIPEGIVNVEMRVDDWMQEGDSIHSNVEETSRLIGGFVRQFASGTSPDLILERDFGSKVVVSSRFFHDDVAGTPALVEAEKVKRAHQKLASAKFSDCPF